VWLIVYLGNFVGAVLVAWLLAYQTDILAEAPWSDFLEGLVVKKSSAGFWKTFVKGIGANWLVCLAVWMSYAAKDVGGKSLALWLPVMAFVALGYEHSIANMFCLPTGIFDGANLTWGAFMVKNLLPATLGNIVGGAVFVGAAYWYMFLKPDKTTVKPEPVWLAEKPEEKKVTKKQLVEF
jgi:formate/nitrite transporter